jgi:hypothetical protein
MNARHLQEDREEGGREALTDQLDDHVALWEHHAARAVNLLQNPNAAVKGKEGLT